MNKVTPYLIDATPGLAAASVSEIPNLDPYLQAIILVISGVTALVRLWKSIKNKPKQVNE